MNMEIFMSMGMENFCGGMNFLCWTWDFFFFFLGFWNEYFGMSILWTSH